MHNWEKIILFNGTCCEPKTEVLSFKWWHKFVALIVLRVKGKTHGSPVSKFIFYLYHTAFCILQGLPSLNGSVVQVVLICLEKGNGRKVRIIDDSFCYQSVAFCPWVQVEQNELIVLSTLKSQASLLRT